MRVDSIDRTFSALSDATRRGLLARLAAGPAEGCAVTDLAEPYLKRMSLPAVSRHLRVLRDAGLVVQHKDGRVRRCVLQPTTLREAHDWLAFYKRFWTNQLDALAAFVEDAHQAEQRARRAGSTPLHTKGRPKR